MLNLRNMKLTYKRALVRVSLITLLASGVILPAPIPSLFPLTEVGAEDCQPAGASIIGPFSSSYDWIANGTPLDSSCWSPVNASFVQHTNVCGWTDEHAWEFYYSGGISQSFTIPSDRTQPNFNISYLMDFIDPKDDGFWNRFEMYVTDMTTGALLTYDSFNGGMGDLYCSRRSISWNQNLAGHTIMVRFKGSRGYNDTYIRVRGISLWQW